MTDTISLLLRQRLKDISNDKELAKSADAVLPSMLNNNELARHIPITSPECALDFICKHDPVGFHFETLINFEFDAWEETIHSTLKGLEINLCCSEMNPQSAIILARSHLDNKSIRVIHRTILQRLLSFGLASYREVHQQHDPPDALAHKLFPHLKNFAEMNEQQVARKITALLNAGLRYKLVATNLGLGSLFLLGDLSLSHAWEVRLPSDGPCYEKALAHLRANDVVPMGKIYEEFAERINSRLQNLMLRHTSSKKRMSDFEVGETSKRNKNQITMDLVQSGGDSDIFQPSAPIPLNHAADFESPVQVERNGREVHNSAIIRVQNNTVSILPSTLYSTETKSNAENSHKELTTENIWPTTGDTCLSTAGINVPPFQLSERILDFKENRIADHASIMTPKISEAREGKTSEVNKLRLYLGTCLMNAIYASSMRKKEEADSNLKFTGTVSLVVPPIKGNDFTLKVTLSKSFGKSILEVINSAQCLHHLLGGFIFKAMKDSRVMCEAKYKGIRGFSSAITVFFENDCHDGIDCKMAIMLNYLMANKILVDLFLSS